MASRAERRRKTTGRRESGGFVKFPHAVLDHPNFYTLSPRALKLLMDITSQFKGQNNGHLSTAWSILSRRGWSSKEQFGKARRELLDRGWIVQTRQGRLPRVASLFALTWFPIDKCGGKLERRATNTALGYWKIGYNPEGRSNNECDPRRTGQSDPPYGSIADQSKSDSPAPRVNGEEHHAIH